MASYTMPAGIYVAAAATKQLSTRSGTGPAGMYVVLTKKVTALPDKVSQC